MKIIVGLGNPGEKYRTTRHNIGFEAIDYIAAKSHLALQTEKYKALYGKGSIAGEQVLLVKPQTFMNLSGESVLALSSMYKVPPQDFIVVYDDFHLNFGSIRIRKNGSAGGHNGIKSIIGAIGDQFARLRMGIGGPGSNSVDFVLSRFSGEEYVQLSALFPVVYDSIAEMIRNGVDSAMSKFNITVK